MGHLSRTSSRKALHMPTPDDNFSRSSQASYDMTT
jgi:hypothetical protein